MDLIYTNKIPIHLFIIFFMIGVSLLILFYIVSNYIIPLIKERHHLIYKWWKRIQIIIWSIYVIVLFYSMLQANLVITSIFTIIILTIGWNYWTNIFAGILIKFNRKLKRGDIISTDFAEGEVKIIHLAQTELITDKGELIVVPNSKLRTDVLKKIYNKSKIKTHTFTIKLDGKKTSEEIKEYVINCPYIAANQTITVENNINNEYTVIASVIDKTFINKTKEYLNNTNY